MASFPTANFSFGAYRGTIQNLAVLRSTTTSSALNKGDTVQVTASINANDHGGGNYVWLPTATDVDDGALFIQPADIPVGQPGRWCLFGDGANVLLENELATVSATVTDPVYGNVALNASYENEVILRASGDSALSEQITTLNANVSDDVANLNATITDVQSAFASTTEALASRTTTLEASYSTQSGEINSLQNQANGIQSEVVQTQASVSDEASARASADGALATRTTNLEASYSSQSTTIGNLQNQANGLQTQIIQTNASASDEASARANADSALATRATNLEASYSSQQGQINGANQTISNIQASVTSEASARASADGALSSRIDSINATVSGSINPNLVPDVSEWVLYTGAYYGVATYGPEIGANATSTGVSLVADSPHIQCDPNTDYSISVDMYCLNINSGDLCYAQISEYDAGGNYIGDVIHTPSCQNTGFSDSHPRSAYSGHGTTTSNAATINIRFYVSIPTGSTSFHTGIGIRNPKIEHGDTVTAYTLEGQVAYQSAQIRNEQTARADADSAMASTIQTLTATVNNNYNAVTSSITNEANVRASADSTAASAISALQSTVGNNTASISNLSNTVATNNSVQATEINTLTAFTGPSPNLVADVSAWTLDDSSLGYNLTSTWGASITGYPTGLGAGYGQHAHSPRVNVAPNTAYTFSCDLLCITNGGSQDQKVYAQVRQFDGNGNLIGDLIHTNSASATDFNNYNPLRQNYWGTATTASNAATCEVELWALTDSGQNYPIIGIRQPKFEQGSAPTTYTIEGAAQALNASLTTQAGAISTLNGKTSAYWTTTAVAGNNRAQLSIHADANGGAGVDIIGDVSISGNLVVDGSLTTGKLGNNTVTLTYAAINTNAFTGDESTTTAFDTPPGSGGSSGGTVGGGGGGGGTGGIHQSQV